MLDQEKQSAAAEAAGVCHTDGECDQMYAALSPELKAPALEMLAIELAPTREEIVNAYKADPEGWHIPYHFWWGMNVRNLLRQKGFGEEHFGIHNLDDIYIALVSEALKLTASE